MAGGGIVGYEPVDGQPDALNFKTSDGRSLLAFGPEAMQLKERLDSTPRPLFAGPGAQGYEDAAAGMSMPGPPPPQRMGPPPAAPPPASAPPGQLPSQAAAPVGAPTPTGDLGSYLTAPVRVAGSPGVSREQLQAKAAQGVATPKSATAGVEGGFTPDADYLDNLGSLSVDERMNQQGLADRESARAEAEANLYRDQYAKNAAKEAAAARHSQLMQEGVSKDEAALATARHAYSSSKVDPSRMFSGEVGTLRLFGASIAAGLGAWASATTGTPNYAQSALDNSIERDIRAQEAEIKIKGVAADNALQDLARHTGSMETAKSALRVIQADQVQRQIAAFAADSKSQKIKDAAAAWDIDHQKALNDKVEDYRQRSIGKVTQQVQQEMLYPKAATGGGYRAPTDVEVAKRAGIAKTVQDIGASRANVANTEADTTLKGAQVGKTEADAEKARAEAVGGPEDKEFKKAATGIANHKAQLENLTRKYGYEIKDGKIVEGPKGAGFPTRFNPSGSAGLDTGLTALGVTFSSIANNDAELGEAAKAKLTPSPTETDATIVQKLQAQLDYVNAKEGAVKGSAAPGAVKALENNQRGRGAAIRAQAEGGRGGAGAPAFQEE